MQKPGIEKLKFIKINALIPLFICATSSAIAAEVDFEKAMAFCATKADDSERLECYDGLAANSISDAPQASTPSLPETGKWQVSDAINPMDDSRVVTLVLTADSGQNRYGDPVSLYLRCSNESTKLYINWGDFLAEEVYVLTRLGGAKPVTRQWSLTTDSKASIYAGSPIPFIRSMFRANRLVAQVTTYSEGQATALFDIRGLKQAAAPLMDACRWSASSTPPASSVQSGLGSDDIKTAQAFLEKIDYFFRSPDGEWSIETEMAIKQYQTKKGLEPTGKLDSKLLELMREDDSGRP
jgi:type VI secretion system protein VasI